MAGDYISNHLKDLWQEVSTDPVHFTLDDLHRDEEKLRKRVRRRSLGGGGAALIGIVVFAVYFFAFPGLLMRIGAVLTVLGAGYGIVQLRMRSARAMPDMGGTESIRFYRAELERQRDFHTGAWLWSRLIILLPGPIVWMVGFARSYPKVATIMWVVVAIYLVLSVRGALLNLRLARKYQRRIDALDAALKG
jgi:Flp pilus assembly protein TadB